MYRTRVQFTFHLSTHFCTAGFPGANCLVRGHVQPGYAGVTVVQQVFLSARGLLHAHRPATSARLHLLYCTVNRFLDRASLARGGGSGERGEGG